MRRNPLNSALFIINDREVNICTASLACSQWLHVNITKLELTLGSIMWLIRNSDSGGGPYSKMPLRNCQNDPIESLRPRWRCFTDFRGGILANCPLPGYSDSRGSILPILGAVALVKCSLPGHSDSMGSLYNSKRDAFGKHHLPRHIDSRGHFTNSREGILVRQPWTH